MIMGYGISTATHARLLNIVFCVLTAAFVTSASQYVWKTGRWRDCEHHACGAGGTRIRIVFCGKDDDNYYTETDDSKCDHLPKPRSMEECFKVCSFHHDKIKWAEPQFSECVLDPKYSECSVHHGIRYRNVTCVWRDDGRVEDDSVCSEFAPKPDEHEKCSLKCRQDCVVSLFSPWQGCDTCIISNQTRTRNLIVPPANGGTLCPPFSEMIPCDTCKDTYTYHIGAWDDCTKDNSFDSISKIHPLIGFQQRRIQCLNSYGSAVIYSNCNYPRSTIAELTAQQTCIIPQDCIVSPYSSMISLNESCYMSDGTLQLGYMIKTRKILQIPLGAGRPCPPLIRYFPVRTSEKKQCARTYWKLSSWGECEAPPGGIPCTAGLQTQKAICVQKQDNSKEKPVPESMCTERRPLTTRVCTAKCDLDCTLSQWSEWTECKVTDCELYLRRKRDNEGTGQRHRTRTILTEPQGKGMRCLHLSETQICDPQPCYSWNMTVGTCQLLNPNSFPPCGLGIAMRTLACVNKHGIRVADSKCEELGERPNPRQDCDIPCPDDCILSEWTSWSPCPNLCQEGRSKAAQRHRHRAILAQAGPRGKQCPMSRYLTEVQHCPTTIECAIYVWQTGDWRPCRVNSIESLCGVGTQTRDVGCYSYPAGHPVPDQRCTLSVKPIISQKCDVPCPIDCNVTDWSDWSACDAECWEAKQTVPIKKRFRYIVQHPSNGGKPCPNTLTETDQCTNLTFCESFYWDMEPWSRCYLPLHKIPQCGQGLRARNVSCRSENSTIQPVDICIKHIGPIPPVSQKCYKACDEECVFGEWSQWSRCINGCNGNRYRTRKLIDDNEVPVIVKCRDRRLYPLDEQESCLCDDHKPVPLGNWSECILEPEDNSYRSQNLFGAYVAVGDPGRETMKKPSNLGISSICGPGKRYKVLACQNDKGEVESAQRCSEKPYDEEVCLLPCPVDCVMSDWSRWTDCSTSCGTGSQMRYRHIKQIPSYGGRKCPSLDNAAKETQTRVCVTRCQEYQWRVYAWTACWPNSPELKPCGEGTQSRNVRCEMETAMGYTNEAVDEIMCSRPVKPHDRQPCYAPCVGECVVSEWSDWSRCRQPCTDPNQVQTRIRKILRQPEPELGNSCPSLLEERFCIRGGNCIEYMWTMSVWTSCLVNNGLGECGIGHRERFPVCKDQNDRIVDNSECEQALGESTEPVIESCTVPCDVDCLLSEWSPWSTCSQTCGVGYQLRTRDVVQEATGNGRFCQMTREQSKPCFKQGCYSWYVSDWSPCTTQKGVCGYGTQIRNITCVGDGGLPVNSSNCEPDLDIIVLQTEQSCRMPCPGECIVTEWTPWNECYINCKDFERGRYTRGVQSRSRAILAYSQLNNDPCPDQLWESRPCEASRCFTFHWKRSNWTVRDTREIWCQRSDGMNVTGGCSEDWRPATELNCNPPCTADLSFCNDTNHCVCKPKYTAVYNKSGKLLRCTMSNLTSSGTTTSTVTLPEDGASNVWMYAVIASVTVFVIFLAAACYTMSEFFTKGPRPRKKDQEKSLEGAEIVEFTESSCNHVARSSDVNIVDAISADRTPPPDVGAHACVLAIDENENVSLSNDVRDMHEIPPRIGQHAVKVMHDKTDFIDGYNPQPRSQVLINEINGVLPTHMKSELSIVRDSLNSSPTGEVNETSSKNENHFVAFTKPKSSSTLRSDVNNRITEVPKLDLDQMNTSASFKDEGDSERSSIVSEEVRLRSDVSPISNTEESQADKRDLVKQNVVEDFNLGDTGFSDDNVGSDLDEESEIKFHHSKSVDKRKSTSSLGNMLQEYFEKKWTIATKNGEVLNEQNEDSIEQERAPLLRKNYSANQIRTQRPSLTSAKSHSLDQRNINGYDTDLSLPENRSFSDDESLDQTQSVRSHASGRSRLSNLSVSNGPSISIDPKYVTDVNQNTIPKEYLQNKPQSKPAKGVSRRRIPNLSNIAFSSVDTEPSTAPSTSVSCESLSPRSLQSEISGHSSTGGNKLDDIQIDKSGRNIAMDSLKRAGPRRTHKVAQKENDVYNGNSPKAIKSSTPQTKRKPQVSPHNSLHNQVVVLALHEHHNGDKLLTPFHFQNGKSESEI